MKTILYRHFQVLGVALGRMAVSPLKTLVTTVVLSIAIALPIMLYKISDSTSRVTGQWQGNTEMTVFLALGTGESPTLAGEALDEAAVDFGQGLLQIPTIRDIKYISPVSALEEFRRNSGMGDMLADLPVNPLPPVLVIYPEVDLERGEIEVLAEQLNSMPEVDAVSHDQMWLERLAAITTLLENLVLVLAVLMAIGVVLIVSNTVQSVIQDRVDEIEIVDQIGGDAAFIRRPFLYHGVLHGIAGALLALVLANGALYFLAQPVLHLAELYDSSFRIERAEILLSVLVVGLTALLGWLAARVTVDSYLRRLRANVRGK